MSGHRWDLTKAVVMAEVVGKGSGCGVSRGNGGGGGEGGKRKVVSHQH